MAIFLLIVGLVLFVGLVVVHELGHFLVARRNGVEIEEFGIGFPPVLWRKRVKSPKGDYDFTLNALPLGGFCAYERRARQRYRTGHFWGSAFVG